MAQLFKMALIGAQLLSSTVIGQDNYGDPSAPLLLPTGNKLKYKLKLLIQD